MTDLDKEVVIMAARCNMNFSEVARQMFYGLSAIRYRCKKIREETGLNPCNFYDLHELVVMVRHE